ncbi:Leucine repeat-rich protein [Operophtera brumata]|uniref:Leucine repeat-rich protein n=1 Tax=Operophtera brumata TaxID=104452 RepID=A0A0L7LA25_OPEBR|nr:Leucine repeat-rich protein [Operophtera brumata]
MYIIFIVFAIISRVNSDTADTICDICVCGFDSKNAGDFQGETVDCSYNVGVLNLNYTIPSTIHSLDLSANNNKIGQSLQESNLFDRSGFGLTEKIKSLSIRGISLNPVPDNFFVDAYDIRKLVISGNSIADVFELPFTLEYLDLSDNPIAEIEGEDFNELPALKVLKLNNVAIKEVPEYAFSPLHSLLHLELERNQNLTEFSALTFGREVIDDADDFLLESLSLKNSRLWRLDRDLRVPFERLIRLDLQGNRWKCDCKLVWIKSLQIPEKENEHLRHYVGAAIAGVALCVILATIAIWFFVFVPKYYTRGNILSSMYAPSTAYSVLPMATTVRGVDDL